MAYHVYFLNHGYFAQDSFADFDSAVAYAKSKGFEATILKPHHTDKPHKGGEVVGSWSILGGLRDRRTS
jgi:hypothetical protein